MKIKKETIEDIKGLSLGYFGAFLGAFLMWKGWI